MMKTTFIGVQPTTILNDGTMINFGAHLNAGVFHIKKYRNPKTGKFTLEKMPVYHIVGDEKEKKAS